MQTFLPFQDFAASAKVLDMKRLGKQRVETLQVLKAITTTDYGWKNHPAVKMWQGHVGTLFLYQIAVCEEWTSRGYKDTCLEKSKAIVMEYLDKHPDETESFPTWLGDAALHRSHRSNLVRKAPDIYRPLFEKDLPDNLEYVWPVKTVVSINLN